MSGRAKRLVIVVNGDFTLRENGAQVRVADQVDFARQHWADLAVYSHREHPSHGWTAQGEARFAAMFPDVELIVEHAAAHIRWATRIRNATLALAPGLGRLLVTWTLPGGPPRYAEMRRCRNVLFWVNFVDGCTVLNGLPDAYLVETHDVRFVKQAKKLGLPVHALRILGKIRSEVAILARARAATMISPVDQHILSAVTPGLLSFLVPSYIERPPPEPSGNTPARYDLLFVGAYNNFNVDGLSRFLRDSQHWLHDRTLLVCGRVANAPEIREIARNMASVTLLGFVDDLSSVYAEVRAVISPVDGTGLKIKVLEALGHGKPVLGSDHSRAALPPGSEACVFPLDRAHVEMLLDSPTKLASAERAARLFYSELGARSDRESLLTYLKKELGC